MFRKNIFLPSSRLNNFRNILGYIGKFKEGAMRPKQKGANKDILPETVG
jgi:hypothetical protein